MKKSSTSVFFFYLFFSCSTLFAQNNNCTYQLQLIDFFGDGWNGTTITAITGQDTTTYTLPDSTVRFFDLKLAENELLQLYFTAGPKDEEIRYILFDENGDIIFNDGPSPQTGLVFETFACPTCLTPKNVSINPSDESATIHWSAFDKNSEYLVAYGPKGFRQNDGILITIQDTILTLPNLLPFTEYDVYLTTVCANQDTSLTTVSTSFQTKYTNDVGISNVQMPRSDCQLSNAEMLTVTLENYGALPQSLIPFRFSINGEDGGVMIPNDGFFTNVLGKDSSVTLTFETTYDFTESGLYDIAVWTELAGDEQLGNDTAYVQIRSTPTIAEFPYSEDFKEGEAGWFSTNPSIQFEENSTSQNPLQNDNQNWIFNVDTTTSASQQSYLFSPCFDFSNYDTDPKIAFQLLINTNDEASQFWLEISIDNGQNWRKVVTDEAAFNWYNTPNEAAWTNVFGKGVWQYMETPLQSVAGQAQTRFRYVFEKGVSETIGPKVAIDDVQLFLPTNENVVTLAAQNTAANSCGIRTDGVQLELYNASNIVVSGVTVYYQINEDKPVVEVADTLVLAPNERQTYTFEQTFNSSKAGTYTIKAWVQSSGETVPLSDTTYYQFSVTPPLDVPFVEDFEDRVIDPGWFAVGNVEVTLRGPGDHNNESHIMAANLWSSANRTAIHSARYGVISEGDSLSFDYRLVLWENATLPLTMNGDSILIEVSTDCGQSFSPIYSIQADNHTTLTDFQRINLDLSAFAGNNINFRFVCVWGNGDYWLDFDNISILPGLMTSAVNLNLASDFQVFPNPTSGQATVEVMLPERRPISLQVLNQLGQVVYRKELAHQRVIQEVIDLQRQTAGIYFVQFLVGNQVFSRKLLLAK